MVLEEKLAQPFRNFFVNHLNEEMLTILNKSTQKYFGKGFKIGQVRQFQLCANIV